MTGATDSSDIGFSRYRALVWRRAAIVLALMVAAAAAFVADVATGPSNLPMGEVVRGILAPGSVERTVQVILWDVRLPYALMALLVGGALSLAGAEMQTILNNPLASPFTLGISSAASFGAALAIVLGFALPGLTDNWVISGNAFIFAFGSALLLQTLARTRGTGVQTLILFGIALFFTFNALVSLLQFVASQEALQQLVFWIMGSLARATWEKLQVLTVILLVILPFSLASAWPMTTLRLGEDRARSFGVRVNRLRFFSLLRVSILAASAIAFAGTISFIGLVGPHIARLLVGEDHRFLLPASVLSGALVLSLASVASKSLVPGALLPVGIVTALIGIPFFVVLIYLRREPV